MKSFKRFKNHTKLIRVLFAALLTGMTVLLGSYEVEASNGGDWYFDENGFWFCYYDNTYPYSQWREVDGNWYYFDEKGYIVYNEWRDGYWIGADYVWSYGGRGSWKSDSTGWWFEDSYGWWPSSEWQKIDGKWYYFAASGYMEHDKYIDGCWLGSDGAWTDAPSSEEKKDDSKDSKDKKDDKETKDDWEKKVTKAQVSDYNTKEKWAEIKLVNGEIYKAKNLDLDAEMMEKYYPGLKEEQVIKAEAYAEYMASSIKEQGYTTDLEILDATGLYTALWIAFDENDLSRIEEAVAATPYGFFVEDAFNETGAAFAMGRMLHYLGYNDWTHVVEADGKQYLDVKITEGIVRVDFYHGKAYIK